MENKIDTPHLAVLRILDENYATKLAETTVNAQSRFVIYRAARGLVILNVFNDGGCEVYAPIADGIRLDTMLDALRQYLSK